MKIRIHVEAEAEIAGAIDFYERARVGLGEELMVEIDRALEAILTHPRAWPRLNDLAPAAKPS